MKNFSWFGKKWMTAICAVSLSMGVFAQEETELSETEQLAQRTQALEEAVSVLKKFKVSGYIQAQYQNGQQDASLKVGAANENPEESFDRFGIRRGRVKFTFEDKIVSSVFQLDMTEKGVGIKDAYLSIKDIWWGTNSLKAGVFDRPFGYEISYSSSRRESPERSTVFQTLFPEERDLGGMLTLQAAKTSPWNILKLEAGLFAGNGIKQETDNHKDFIGHLSANKNIGSDMKLSGGVSYYNGGVYQGTSKVYTMQGNGFVVDDNEDNIGEFAKREYFGIDAQFALNSALGMTKLTGEYLLGEQPGAEKSTKSPNSSSLPTTDTYIRNFNGGYVMLVQDLGSLPLSAVVKYDWYDPNTKVSGDEIGQNGTTKADISQNTIGMGLLWRATNAIRVQAYYEINNNEKSQNLAGYDSDRKDNVFTLRLQYKF
jgi:phosphate-selective porin